MDRENNFRHRQHLIVDENWKNDVLISNPKNWSADTKYPIVSNNSLNLGYVENRTRMKHTLIQIINNNQIEFDVIVGASKEATPWAAMLAHAMGKKFVVVEDEGAFEINLHINTKADIGPGTNIFVSPNKGIPAGIILADAFKMPFIYVDRTKNPVIQGHVNGSKNPCIITFGEEPNLEMMKKVLKNENFLEPHTLNFEMNKHLVDLNGVKVLVIEDLLADQGHAFAEIDHLQKLGAEVTDILCLFNYELEEASKYAKEHQVRIHSLITYQQVINLTLGLFIQNEHKDMLIDWRRNPKTWGQKYFHNAKTSS